MMDNDKVWLIPENEQEEEIFKKFTDDKESYNYTVISYKDLKSLSILDYIQIGKYNNIDELLGFIRINNRILECKDFKPDFTLNNKYFIPFIKYLFKGLKMSSGTPIYFYYKPNKPVVVVCENKKGIIAYRDGDYRDSD